MKEAFAESMDEGRKQVIRLTIDKLRLIAEASKPSADDLEFARKTFDALQDFASDPKNMEFRELMIEALTPKAKPNPQLKTAGE